MPRKTAEARIIRVVSFDCGPARRIACIFYRPGGPFLSAWSAIDDVADYLRYWRRMWRRQDRAAARRAAHG